MKHLILITVLLIVGCGKNTEQRPVTAPPEIAKYVAEFEELFGSQIYNVNISFGDLESRVAQCTFSTGEIIVDQTRWGQMCELQKRAVIFHELGHCVLDRDHTNDGDPPSYMNPALRFCSYFEENKDMLDAELFN